MWDHLHVTLPGAVVFNALSDKLLFRYFLMCYST